MKIICLQRKLKKFLNITDKIAGQNLLLPILSNILIKTEDNLLKILATDLEIGIIVNLSAKIEKNGVVCINSKIFTSFVNSILEEKIVLEKKGDYLLIRSEKYNTKIKTQNANDFPIIPKIKSEDYFEIDVNYLKKSLNQILNSVGISETRPEISGIFLNFKNNILKLTTTDSFRLSEKTIPEKYIFKNIENSNRSLIIPLKTIQNLIKILDSISDEEKSIKIFNDENQILFDLHQIKLISRLIEGTYPDYEQIIPHNFKTRLYLNKDEFQNSIKTLSIFASKINEIKFKINKRKSEVIMYSGSIDIGEIETKIPAKIEGENLEISFNYKYILDGLSNLKNNKIIFDLIDEVSPAILHSEKDEGYIYLLMPIKSI